ncbi:MAG: hypothetical protein HOO06_02310 [Bdellovibrionaceae bacterium]|jgi:hypothetical protein|nr:hypothetical protein [Pseudobdellovibrionaceae bacterium]
MREIIVGLIIINFNWVFCVDSYEELEIIQVFKIEKIENWHKFNKNLDKLKLSSYLCKHSKDNIERLESCFQENNLKFKFSEVKREAYHEQDNYLRGKCEELSYKYLSQEKFSKLPASAMLLTKCSEKLKQLKEIVAYKTKEM